MSQRDRSGLLVFIPGFRDVPALWRSVIDRLALPGSESAPVTLRGTGRAEPSRRGATLEASDDTFVSRELVRDAVAPRFRDVKTAYVPGAGHWPHMEQPAAVAGALTRQVGDIERFLKRRPRSTSQTTTCDTESGADTNSDTEVIR